ncbi:MAG: hypothetical protein ACLRTI_00290 [Blautia sp.]
MNYKKFKNLKKHFMSTFKKQLKTKILLGLLIIGILCILPFIALKYGASGEGLLGYFGAIIGGSIGALVAGWGIVTTIKENRRQAVAPCLIFQEVKADKIPEGSVINSCWIIRDGEDQIFQIIKVKNVGSGATLNCRMGERNCSFFQISDIIDKNAEKYIQIICNVNKLDNSHNMEWTRKDIKNYAFQAETIPLIFEYKDILGEVHTYELLIKLQCDIRVTSENIASCTSIPNLKLVSWKPLQ